MFDRAFERRGFVGLIAVLLLSSCASPEQTLHDRQTKLEHFATGAVRHLLDRNPKTYRMSVNSLMREELNDATINKLQSIGKLPEPGLEELKVVEDAEDAKTNNAVEIKDTKTLGPANKDVVPIRVKGLIVNYKNGIKKSEEPFSLELDCKLTEDMEGFPRVIAVRGMEKPLASSVRPHLRSSR
jgi:hypothetical protein